MTVDKRKASAGKAHKPARSHPWVKKSYDAMLKRKAVNDQKRLEALRKAKDGERAN
jgi:hypothetical protein